MKTFLLFVFAFFIHHASTFGQCPQTLNFSTQAQINSFPIQYPGCDSVNFLTISGNDITDLSPLTGLRKVRSSVRISKNPLLPDLKGLESLVHGGSSFWIDSNVTLQTLEGLESFTGVYEHILIENNPRLKNLIGLTSLKDVLTFEILENDSLQNMDGLESLKEDVWLNIVGNPQLTHIDGLHNLIWGSVSIINNDQLLNIDGLENAVDLSIVHIVDNASLQDLKGLKNVKEIYYGLQIIDNPSLTSLGAWENIYSMGSIRVVNNDQLTNLDGLESLERLGSTIPIVIEDNESLVSIEGLNGIEYMYDEGLIRIRNNTGLSECALLYFCKQLHSPEQTIIIENNGLSCNSLDEILGSCQTENSYVTGTVFIDLNCNGILDNGDALVPEHIIQSTEGIPLTSTSQQGQYIRYLHLNDTVSLHPKGISHFTFSPSSYQFMTDSTHQVFDSADFAFCPDTLFHDLAVSLTGYNAPRPGFTNRYQVCVQNIGTYVDGGNLVFDFSNAPGSEYITILSADNPGIVNGTTVTWLIDTIPVFLKICFDVEIMLDASASLGNILFPHVSITPIGSVAEIDLSNNEMTLSQTVVGSVDPNEKTVNADRINWGDDFAPLEYIIRFQNTGTFPATFIEIADTLVNELDIRSFEMIASSHPYIIDFPDTNIIKWRFDNINLPDSLSNEPESHGFVHYKINTRSNLDYNTIIRNKAAIYFDFNDPLITNSTSTIVDVQIKTNEPVTLIENVLLFPNPNSGLFYLQFELKEKTSGLIEIFNSQGNTLFAKNIGLLSEGIHSIPVEITSISNGIYFFRLLTNKGLITKKIILSK